MAKQPFISHVVNGYSRYDVPESKAFSCTPGILYPVRIDFINARDRVTIDQGIDIRSNPLAVPTFNPYTVRLHRFWVPLQLYHSEMRTNSSKFDMNDLTTNWIPSFVLTKSANDYNLEAKSSYSNSLFSWLRAASGWIQFVSSSGTFTAYDNTALPNSTPENGYYGGCWVNADTYLAYWDIVRNYYSYSQWGLYSYAFPASWKMTALSSGSWNFSFGAATQRYFTQAYGNLQFLDAYYESQFYPNAVSSTNNTFNRSNLFFQIVASDIDNTASGLGSSGDGFPVVTQYANSSVITPAPTSQFATNAVAGTNVLRSYFVQAHPMAVVPSSPDRFSRLLPTGSDSSVSMTGVSTIPQLAVASRLQEYKDLLGAGGSRFSDWLETFFASKIEHVDRPKLLFSASCTVNAQVVMNQAGFNTFQPNSTSSPLGAQGGAIAFNSKLGRTQSYYFREPGYMIDILSIRPVYYWAGIRPDYLDYQGADYFNPIYNDIGYQSVNGTRFGGRAPSGKSVANEPCFNEFRSSYDEALGQLSVFNGSVPAQEKDMPLYAYWLQQRSLPGTYFETAAGLKQYMTYLFVDLSTVNSPFASNVEDNFFVNLSYSVRKKNLVNKTFATRLSNR